MRLFFQIRLFMVLIFGLMAVAGGLHRGAHQPKTQVAATDPWGGSANVVVGDAAGDEAYREAQRQANAMSSATASTSYSSGSDRARDEEFRRQMVHDMRVEYERTHGPSNSDFASLRDN